AASTRNSPFAAPAGQCSRTRTSRNSTPGARIVAMLAVAVRACAGHAASATSNSVKMRTGIGRAYPLRREATMNPRILLVEDDPTSRAFLQAATEALPAVVDIAGSVAEALALATRHAHALWLIDAHLPDGSGSELLRVLRDQ